MVYSNGRSRAKEERGNPELKSAKKDSTHFKTVGTRPKVLKGVS